MVRLSSTLNEGKAKYTLKTWIFLWNSSASKGGAPISKEAAVVPTQSDHTSIIVKIDAVNSGTHTFMNKLESSVVNAQDFITPKALVGHFDVDSVFAYRSSASSSITARRRRYTMR